MLPNHSEALAMVQIWAQWQVAHLYSNSPKNMLFFHINSFFFKRDP